MVNSFKKGLETAIPVTSPKTHIETLATGDPGRSYTILREHIINTKGTFESVTDEEAFRAMHALAKMEGISVEPRGGCGICRLIQTNSLGSNKINRNHCGQLYGAYYACEEFILGSNWTRDVQFPTKKPETPEDGLLAALNQVAPNRFPHRSDYR